MDGAVKPNAYPASPHSLDLNENPTHGNEPPRKALRKPEGERRGLIIVNTGDGGAKAPQPLAWPCAMAGGKAVKIYQFHEVPTARFGEHHVFEQIGIPTSRLGDAASAGRARTEHSIWPATAGKDPRHHRGGGAFHGGAR